MRIERAPALGKRLVKPHQNDGACMWRRLAVTARPIHHGLVMRPLSSFGRQCKHSKVSQGHRMRRRAVTAT
jgi:hypothetical protein